MKNYVLVFEYNSKKFMDIDKIIVFKKNLKTLQQDNKNVKLVFFGDGSNEDLAVFMSYFNSLVGEKLCNFSISSRAKEIVVESGINNKSIKLSTKNAREIKNKNFDNIVQEYYSDIENIEIKLLPTKDWESTILDL